MVQWFNLTISRISLIIDSFSVLVSMKLVAS